ncbi:MAG TPA: DUF2875 family protein [Luteibacter sp.]|uniref:type VI lipase adapter Tla3 domain-containing protein n=1 Tax=Luteibacter sp. TaxID=1886636 RepID=UPI002B59321D|nr:DUF2875 family protein [Luteibacter sp.]HVI55666.1 DUF2875 family protein [Luteibacter sp.]
MHAINVSLVGACIIQCFRVFDEHLDRFAHIFGGPDVARFLLTIVTGAILCGTAYAALKHVMAEPEPESSHTLAPTGPLHDRLLAGRGTNYALEIRNAVVAVQGWGGRQLWRKVRETASQDRSFLENEDPERAYPRDVASVGQTYGILSGAVFGSAGTFAVEYWPVPTFVLGPPQHPEAFGRPADYIRDGRQGGGLAVTLFLWQDDEMSENGQAMIERLFAFFDANPDVPEALVVVNDGDYERIAPGSGLLSRAAGIPRILNTHAAMLVSRSDRVDKIIRPYVNHHEGDVSLKDTESVGTRFWQFYWHKNNGQTPDAFEAYYTAKLVAEGKSGLAPMMSTDWWHTQLPEFWNAIGPQGDFKPTPFLPIRWTAAQLKHFDNTALVGYLHRPVRVPLRDDEGKSLPRSALVANLQAGWAKALNDAQGGRPSRVVFDSSHDAAWSDVLTDALKGVPEPLALDEEPVGYDLRHRIGNTGAASPLAQIAVAAMAGHEDGRVSATINVGLDGHADIILVTPPDEAQRENNELSNAAYTLFGETK